MDATTHATYVQENAITALKHVNRGKHAVNYGISEAHVNASGQIITMIWLLPAIRFYMLIFSKWARCLLI